MRIIILFFLLSIQLTVISQIKSASIQASGLTCALCSNAIDKALRTLPFIAEVAPDLNTSSFNIQFKQGVPVNFDEMKNKVQAAGFSVSRFEIVVSGIEFSSAAKESFTVNGNSFLLLGNSKPAAQGDVKLTIVDKYFIPAKEFKKRSSQEKVNSYETGKQDGKRIYHVIV
jgi:copper chaperone CopZ